MKRQILQCDLCKNECSDEKDSFKLAIKKGGKTHRSKIRNYDICNSCSDELQTKLVSSSPISSVNRSLPYKESQEEIVSEKIKNRDDIPKKPENIISDISLSEGNKECYHYNKTAPKWGRIKVGDKTVDAMYRECKNCNAVIKLRAVDRKK